MVGLSECILGKENLPVAIIQNGTTEKAKLGIGVAKNLKAIAAENDLSNPAVIVLGEVVKYASEAELAEVLSISNSK